MGRAYYSNSFTNFMLQSINEVHGVLSAQHPFAQEESQRNAWREQIFFLQNNLKNLPNGQIYFEFEIPRIGKRVDNILIIHDIIFVLEFKVGETKYSREAVDQVVGYALDLKHFHEGSHNNIIIPILIATEAKAETAEIELQYDLVSNAIHANKQNFQAIIQECLLLSKHPPINHITWETSIYKPTPTITELAQALYKGHKVEEITRHDAGAINLSITSNRISQIIDHSKSKNRKSICFITGVPGAGKTLAGLNIANERSKIAEDEHAVFLSGNGPLVDVLREALRRDESKTYKERGIKILKADIERKVTQFIQNIHHFRDDCLKTQKAPIEKVVVFDEAQRAWTLEQTTAFMKQKKGIQDFSKSEPHFLIETMDRHKDWCTIICLIGGGQEINKGEAGLEAWIVALKDHFPQWDVYFSDLIISNRLYLINDNLKCWLHSNGYKEYELHLAVSVRSYRSEKVSDFVQALLDLNKALAQNILKEIVKTYPIIITRNINEARAWLKRKNRGTHRTGILVSSGARRLRPCGIDSENGIRSDSGRGTIANWFLNDRYDVRSSSFLEIPATQFAIQGLELDWTCVAWGEDFFFDGERWNYQNFTGTNWKKVNKEETKNYLLNTYRVLLTRARQGIVVYIPYGNCEDDTRNPKFYDNTYKYLLDIGIETLKPNI